MDVGIRELRNNLRRCLDRVKAGETVTITEHGRPIARIEGIRSGRHTLDELIALGRASMRISRRRRVGTGSPSRADQGEPGRT